MLPACVSTMGDSEGNANNSLELPRPGSHLAVIPCSPLSSAGTSRQPPLPLCHGPALPLTFEEGPKAEVMF